MNWSALEFAEIFSTQPLIDATIPDGFGVEVIESNKGTFYQPLRDWKDDPNYRFEALYMDDRLEPVLYLTKAGAIRCCQRFADDPIARDELVWSRRKQGKQIQEEHAIKHTCGHERIATLYGTQVEINNMVATQQSMVCPECLESQPELVDQAWSHFG